MLADQNLPLKAPGSGSGLSRVPAQCRTPGITWRGLTVVRVVSSTKEGTEMASTREVEFTGPCSWLVERPNPLLYDDEAAEAGWYPDSPADMTVIADCGAPATFYRDGSFVCEAGHAMGTLEEELGPYGNEWQREQRDRYEEMGR